MFGFSKDDHSLTATTSSSQPQRRLRRHLRQDSHRESLKQKTRFFSSFWPGFKPNFVPQILSLKQKTRFFSSFWSGFKPNFAPRHPRSGAMANSALGSYPWGDEEIKSASREILDFWRATCWWFRVSTRKYALSITSVSSQYRLSWRRCQ